MAPVTIRRSRVDDDDDLSLYDPEWLARGKKVVRDGGVVRTSIMLMDGVPNPRLMLNDASMHRPHQVGVVADRRRRAEHERILAERDRLAEEMERMADPIAQIAYTVSRIAICDREIGRLNATSTSRCGYIRPVLSGAAPAVAALFLEGVVWDAFIAVAALQALPVASGGAGAKDNARVRRSASSPAAV